MSTLMPLFGCRDELRGPFDDLFNDVFNRFLADFGNVRSFEYKRAYPKVDVYKEDTNLVFEAAVPGLKKDQVSVEVEDGILTIKGEKTVKLEQGEADDSKCCTMTPYIKELKHSSFVRRFVLPDNIKVEDMSSAEATMEDGILKVVFKDAYKELPPPEPKIKAIPIK